MNGFDIYSKISESTDKPCKISNINFTAQLDILQTRIEYIVKHQLDVDTEILRMNDMIHENFVHLKNRIFEIQDSLDNLLSKNNNE